MAPSTDLLELNRRDFLRIGAVGTAAVAGSIGCAPEPPERGTPEVPPARAVGAFELDEISIAELRDDMQGGRRTARRITEAYLTRIEALDRQGPTLRAVIEANPDALSIGDELDRERETQGPRGPLHGVPVLLKDNIDTADRLTTTAGSLALAGTIPTRESFVAEQLRAAASVAIRTCSTGTRAVRAQAPAWRCPPTS